MVINDEYNNNRKDRNNIMAITRNNNVIMASINNIIIYSNA